MTVIIKKVNLLYLLVLDGDAISYFEGYWSYNYE